jgi:hypothetical protein
MSHPPRIARTIPRGKRRHNPRRAAQHLAFIRLLPCVACRCEGGGIEAAHVRSSGDGGTGMKPGDRFAVPLCAVCHAHQHRVGELSFWAALKIDPLNVALRLWAVSGRVEAGERIVFRARQAIELRASEQRRRLYYEETEPHG